MLHAPHGLSPSPPSLRHHMTHTLATASTSQPTSSARPPFDIRQAILLAQCAFQAYEEPEAVSAVASEDAGGTRLTILNRDFLTENYQGFLDVQIVQADNLAVRGVRRDLSVMLCRNLTHATPCHHHRVARSLPTLFRSPFFSFFPRRSRPPCSPLPPPWSFASAPRSPLAPAPNARRIPAGPTSTAS